MKKTNGLVYVTGVARPTPENPIAVNYDRLLVILIFEPETGEIVDAEVNMICSTTRNFIKSLLVGYCLYSDIPQIMENIQSRYWGLSRRALIVCMKDALAKVTDRLRQMGREDLLKGNEGKKGIVVQHREDTICVVGFSKAVNKNPIVIGNQLLIGSFLIKTTTGEILDVQFNTICPKTSEFLSHLILGLSFYTELEEMIRRIQDQYWEDSNRAVITILRDANNKVLNWKLENEKKRAGLSVDLTR